jgi:adipocyte plasma membrane-associated protein
LTSFIGEAVNLVSKTTEVGGKMATVFNSVAPAKDGRIFYTVSSTDCYFDEGLLALDAPSGRLLVYDPIKHKSEVLKEEIHLANGIILSPNEDFVIVAESFQYRLLKHWIAGPKKGN